MPKRDRRNRKESTKTRKPGDPIISEKLGESTCLANVKIATRAWFESVDVEGEERLIIPTTEEIVEAKEEGTGGKTYEVQAPLGIYPYYRGNVSKEASADVHFEKLCDEAYSDIDDLTDKIKKALKEGKDAEAKKLVAERNLLRPKTIPKMVFLDFYSSKRVREFEKILEKHGLTSGSTLDEDDVV